MDSFFAKVLGLAGDLSGSPKAFTMRMEALYQATQSKLIELRQIVAQFIAKRRVLVQDLEDKNQVKAAPEQNLDEPSKAATAWDASDPERLKLWSELAPAARLSMMLAERRIQELYLLKAIAINLPPLSRLSELQERCLQIAESALSDITTDTRGLDILTVSLKSDLVSSFRRRVESSSTAYNNDSSELEKFLRQILSALDEDAGRAFPQEFTNSMQAKQMLGALKATVPHLQRSMERSYEASVTWRNRAFMARQQKDEELAANAAIREADYARTLVDIETCIPLLEKVIGTVQSKMRI